MRSQGWDTSSGTALQGAFYKHLATYLTDRVRQLTEMVGDALTARGGEIALEEVLSNPVFFSLFKRFLTEEKLVDSQLLYFMAELNEYLEMPANDHLLKFARKIAQKYLHGATPMPTVPSPCAAWRPPWPPLTLTTRRRRTGLSFTARRSRSRSMGSSLCRSAPTLSIIMRLI